MPSQSAQLNVLRNSMANHVSIILLLLLLLLVLLLLLLVLLLLLLMLSLLLLVLLYEEKKEREYLHQSRENESSAAVRKYDLGNEINIIK